MIRSTSPKVEREATRLPENLHVVALNYWHDGGTAIPEDFLQDYSDTVKWISALHKEGAVVTYMQRFPQHAEFRHNGVRYVLLPDSCRPHLPLWQVPWSLHHAMRKLCAVTSSESESVVVHFNSLMFAIQLRALRTMLPKRCAIVVQHHSERPWRGYRGQLQKWGLRAADGFFFSASELAVPWVERGLILGNQPVYEVMEGSTSFRRQDREAARTHTRLKGSPVVLWVGQLIARKDPLTVLTGFERILQHAPNAHLHMVYGNDELLSEVRKRIASSAFLSRSATLWGSLPHTLLESFFNSADYFVLGSHYESCGYALAEAMACGVVPVVTNIPSFTAMTDNGRIGACWRAGDSATFTAAFLQVLREPIETLSDRAVSFFEEQLSFQATARKAIQGYREIAAKRAEQGK